MPGMPLLRWLKVHGMYMYVWSLMKDAQLHVQIVYIHIYPYFFSDTRFELCLFGNSRNDIHS